MKSAAFFDLRRFRRERPPVVLLGGLNVVRALGRAGIPVIVGSCWSQEVAFVSRYCHGRIDLPALDNPRAVADVLLQAGRQLSAGLGRKVPLFYTNDSWQRIAQDYRAELAEHYVFLLNDPAVGDALIEKDLFQPFAIERGLPIPRTLEWEEVERVTEPVLVKPRAKFAPEHSAAHLRLFGSQGKARIFPDGRALLANSAAQLLRHEILVQEYIEGGDADIWSFHGFADERGELLDWFIGRKIRTYPALTGGSTYLELARNAELEALGRRIVPALGLKGVFKIDLKRHPRTGAFYVLEVNARFNLWHYLAAANGLNLPAEVYEYLVNGARPAAPGRYSLKHRWIYLRYDWRAYRELAARGELGFGGWLASLIAAPKVCQFFSWRDPLPFLYRLNHMRARLPRLNAALRRWLSTAS